MKKYLRRNLKYLLISIAIYFLGSIFNILLSYSMGYFTNEAVSKNLKLVIFWAIITLIAIIISNFLQSLTVIFRGKFSTRAVLNLKKDLYKKLLKLEESKDYSSYTSIINNDIEVLKKDYFEGIAVFISMIIKIILSSIAICLLNIEIFVIFITITLITTFILPLLKNKLSLKKQKMSKSNYDYTKELKNYLYGMDIIAQFDKNDNFYNRLLLIDKENEKAKEDNKNWDNNISLVSMTLVMLSQMLCMIIAAYFIYLGKIKIGTMITTTQLLNYIVSPVSMLNSNYVRIKSTKKIIDNIQSIFDVKEITPVNYMSGEIEFKNFSLKFEDKILYNNFNYKFEKNKKYLIRGASGYGKTTLIKTLLKRNHNYSGDVFINDMDIKNIPQNQILEDIIYISQNDYIFDINVIENIRLYDQIDTNSIIEELKIKTDVNNIVEISGGEKQKINLARALIRNASVYIFDEPTNFLDQESKDIINNKIFSINEKIVIVISHETDQEYIDKFDYVIDLNNM